MYTLCLKGTKEGKHNNIEVCINNCFRYGASIFAGTFPLLQAFQQIPYNPQCFFMLNSSKTLPPSRWNEVSAAVHVC